MESVSKQHSQPGSREQLAFDAYMKILQNKGASAEALARRRELLNELMIQLADKPCNGEIYREQVELVIENLSKSDWSFFLSIIREFFRFWTNDIKAIAHISAQSGFEIEPVELQPMEGSLKSIWDRLDKEQFSMVENWPIKAYILGLRDAGAEKRTVDTRVKLIKLLLIRLRDAPEFNSKRYRIAVDSCLQMFESKQLRDLFLMVVREFYYFWNGDPDAARYIQLDDQNITA